MSATRRFIARPWLAALLCAATLLIRLLVPAGFMIGNEGGRVTIELCSGVASEPMAMTMPGMRNAASGGDHKHHGDTEMQCPFAGLFATSLGAIDVVQLAAFIAFIVAAGLCATVVPPIVRRVHLRPPPQGPPARP